VIGSPSTRHSTHRVAPHLLADLLVKYLASGTFGGFLTETIFHKGFGMWTCDTPFESGARREGGSALGGTGARRGVEIFGREHWRWRGCLAGREPFLWDFAASNGPNT
jgi:hypothetical protein